MRRSMQFVLLLTCLCLALSACGPGGIGFSPTPEPTQITLLVPSGYSDFYTAKVAEFNKQYPKVQVDVTTNPSSPNPDVTVSGWFELNSQGGDRLEKALDLSPFLEKSGSIQRDDYYPGLLDTFSRGGKLLGLPSAIDPFVMFYNRDLFDQAKVPYPQPNWTWNDFKATAMQLRDPGRKIFAYASNQDYIDSLFFVYQHGGQLEDANHTPQLDSRESIEAVEWYANLYQDDLAPTDEKAIRDFGGGGTFTGITQGQVAMWFGSTSELRGRDGQGYPFKVGIAPLPRDVTSFTVSQMTGMLISSSTKSPQTCWNLLLFLNDQPVHWMIPARKSLAASPAYISSMGKETADAALLAAQNANLISSFDIPTLTKVAGAFTSAVKDVVNGHSSASQALQAAQQQVIPK